MCASVPCQAERTGTLRRLATLRSIAAIWDERKRFRRELERKSKDDPHLLDDIGLTRRWAEAEIARPFRRR
ncbi:MAG: DUF1127 domain-containing protein [Shinella sp.]|nr:DUF1127 domain-containing protein [Shinella sp.]